MTASTKTFAYGTSEENGDTWLLMTRDHMILLDAVLSDLSLEHKTVSVIGTMGVPPGAPGITKLIVEKIVPHEAIAIRAYNIYQSGDRGSADDQWLRAERELLGL
jgi:hypothetical protein